MSFPIESYRDHRATGLTHQKAMARVRKEQAQQNETKRAAPARPDDWRGRAWDRR
jgi:hypothetical protein